LGKKPDAQGGNNMDNRQKGAILTLLKLDKISGSHKDRYWFSYRDFLDPTDNFTSFSCEDLDGKQKYIAVIENLLNTDEAAKIFVEVYGFEEDNGEPYIYADTLIIFSKLSLAEIKRIFNEPEDIFPSDIGEETDFSRRIFLIGDNGNLVPGANLLNDGSSVYYCWWD